MLSDGSIPRLCILRIGGMPWRMFISIGNAIETCAPTSFTLFQADVRHAGHVDEQVVGSDPMLWSLPPVPRGEVVEDRADAERRQDVRRDLEAELAADRPGLAVGRLPEIDLAAHDHVDEFVARREPARLMRVASVGYWFPGNAAGAFEIAEHGAAAGIDQRLDGGIGVLRRVMDLRNVVDGRDAVVELREPAEQFADVDVLRPVVAAQTRPGRTRQYVAK